MKNLKLLLVGFTLLFAAALTFNSCNLTPSEIQALTPPNGISAQLDSSTGIVTVTWNDTTDTAIAGYVIYRKQSLTSSPVQISSRLALAPPYYDTLSKTGISSFPDTFYYQVKSQDQDGNLSILYSEFATVIVRSLPSPPTPPANPSPPSVPSTPSLGSQHFSLLPSTVALWTFNSHNGGYFEDLSSNGFNLSNANNFALTPSPYDSAAVFTNALPEASSFLSHPYANALTMGGTGQITYEVRIYLTQDQIVHQGWVLGTYDGVFLDVATGGQLQASGQKVNGGNDYWFNFVSALGVVPMNQWVDIAIAFDQTSGQAYGYINGTPVQLYVASGNQSSAPTDPFHVSTGNFLVGDDGQDNYPIIGTIDEIRVSNKLVLGAGLPLIAGNPP